ncbi:hypothetical protein IMG5_154500, partial [Ichthyophthirius multifiliis]
LIQQNLMNISEEQKQQFIEIIRNKKQFKKKKEEIKQQLIKEAQDLQQQQVKKQPILAPTLIEACQYVISNPKEEFLSRISGMLMIKEVMELALETVLRPFCQSFLQFLKNTIIQYREENPPGQTFFSKQPNEDQSKYGQTILQIMMESLFAWSCWFYKNTNQTKTKFFLTYEECLHQEVAFETIDKFQYYTQDDLQKHDGKTGINLLMYYDTLIGMQQQLQQSINVLQQIVQLQQETDIARKNVGNCYQFYKEYIEEYKEIETEILFKEDQDVFKKEYGIVEKLIVIIQQYVEKKQKFEEFQKKNDYFFQQFSKQIITRKINIITTIIISRIIIIKITKIKTKRRKIKREKRKRIKRKRIKRERKRTKITQRAKRKRTKRKRTKRKRTKRKRTKRKRINGKRIKRKRINGKRIKRKRKKRKRINGKRINGKRIKRKRKKRKRKKRQRKKRQRIKRKRIKRKRINRKRTRIKKIIIKRVT